jgi:hypothetical protein
MLEAFLTGFQIGGISNLIQNLLQEALPNVNRLSARVPPSETSVKSLSLGVPHCLVYGREIEAGEVDRVERHRSILRKCTGDRSHSRSRSPTPDRNVVLSDITSRGDRAAVGTWPTVVGNPQHFCIKPESLYRYLEPLKPDVSFSLKRQDNYREVKLVVEISSSFRHSGVYLSTNVTNCTERCLWSCIASLQGPQTKVIGLCCLVEGIKAIKMLKADNGSWSAYETDLIKYDQQDLIKRLFTVINDDLAD